MLTMTNAPKEKWKRILIKISIVFLSFIAMIGSFYIKNYFFGIIGGAMFWIGLTIKFEE